MLCSHASKQIQMKSHNVEDAVLEVIDLLCGNILGHDTDGHTASSHVGTDFDGDDTDGKTNPLFFKKIFICGSFD